MNPATRSLKLLTLFQTSQDPVDFDMLSRQLLLCLREWMPVEAALVIENPPRLICPNGFRDTRQNELKERFESEPEILRQFQHQAGRFSLPLFLSDGSEILLTPLIHNRVTEGFLCLHEPDRGGRLHQQKVQEELSPVCADAARIIAGLRAAEARNAGSPAFDPFSSLFSSRLMSNIAHDLRTPLTAARGYLKMLLNGRVGPVSEDQARCLEGALNGLEQLAAIANTVGGGSNFMEQVHLEKLNLQAVWSNAAGLVMDQCISKGIDLKENVHASGLVVCGDAAMIRDIVDHLVDASIALASQGTGCLVEISNSRENDVVLRISFSTACPESELQKVVFGLHSVVFLHGGRLALSTSNDSRRSFILSLPGYNL